MITREDFIFTIGFDGDAAVVDSRAKKEYGSLSTMELAEKGLFRAAFSSALFSKSESDMATFIEYYNKKAGTALMNSDQCARFFGVTLEQVKRILNL